MQKIETTTSSVTTEFEWDGTERDWVPVSKHSTTETSTSVKTD